MKGEERKVKKKKKDYTDICRLIFLKALKTLSLHPVGGGRGGREKRMEETGTGRKK